MGTSTTTEERPLRRDAERNRRLIIDAAMTVFAEKGLRGSYDDIADEAGVGVGTVYRRFPDKQLLIDALFEERMVEFGKLIEDGLAFDDPWEGFVHFMVESTVLQSTDRGLKECVHNNDEGLAHVSKARDEIAPRIELLLQRVQDAGAVRKDLALTDIPMIMQAVVAVAESTREVAPDTWRRTMNVILDGLRTDSPSPMPADTPPLDLDQLAEAMHAGKSAK